MQKLRVPAILGVAGAAVLAFAAAAVPAAAAAKTSPTVLFVGQIDRQDIPTQPGCEPDTLVEPEIAVSPTNPNVVVAAAHDCRYANGGAADISYAWTHDGGAHWHHAPLPKLTEPVGGIYDRASDPVVAFGPDGSVYIATLGVDRTCLSGVTLSRSTDGGATFGAPVTVQQSTSCNYSDDKDWLVIDTQRYSPHYGRIYVFWTPFISRHGKLIGSPQVVRWSDDHGATWSATHNVTGIRESTQNSQPIIEPDGSITDTYLHYPNVVSLQQTLMARTSHDGGATWGPAATIARNIGLGPARIRCCLTGAGGDPVTGEMYAVWEAMGSGETVYISRSSDGVHWSPRIAVTHTGTAANIEHDNFNVGAYGGNVFVTYGTINTSQDHGLLAHQQLSSSYNGGTSFGAPLTLGPVSNLKWAARAGGLFPGDYIGISVTSREIAAAWCVSSQPSNPNAEFHQTVYAALLTP